eukprot:TRINITY_DN6407_c0_g1_i1.p1 TRINITY_DN6407_c0_g1~~TRINITY_DN6407_c0_g1_i1.p1  ORF type:complete len:306 (+),score=16.65 TRINITY_DN6407_c0_g1_i1:122-1039(+)
MTIILLNKLHSALDVLEYPAACVSRVLEEYQNVLLHYKGMNEVTAADHYGSDSTVSRWVKLSGTVKGIGLNVWVPKMYPTHPPLCYVIPSNGTMFCRGHPNLDLGGRVKIKWMGEFTLNYVIGDMLNCFESNPPLQPKWKAPSTDSGVRLTKGRAVTLGESYLLRNETHRKLVTLCQQRISNINKTASKISEHKSTLREAQSAHETVSREILVLEPEVEALTAQLASLRSWVAVHKPKTHFTVADLPPSSPRSLQRIETLALISAVEDDLCLLDKRNLPADDFVKQAVSLGRELFLAKALLRKLP